MKKRLAILALVAVGAIGLGYSLSKFQSATSQGTPAHTISTNMPGMNMTAGTGARYTASFLPPVKVSPKQDAVLRFKVYDANTGAEVSKFDSLYTQLIHLVIVDSNLDYFTHIHPVLGGSVFSITTQFPKSDIYHLYINFQPQGESEQQFGFSLPVGMDYDAAKTSSMPIDASLTKTFGDYQVSLKTDDGHDFNAESMSIAAQVLDFNIKNAKTGEDIKDLHPYLGSFGHLVMINEQNYQYIHIHPIAALNPNFGGPQVQFLPASLFSKITPGVYRVFAQFKRIDQVFVADFTIKVN